MNIEFFLLFVNLVVTIVKLLGHGGAIAIVADNLLMKQRLLIVNRSRSLCAETDSYSLAFWSHFLIPRQIERAAGKVRPSTLLKFSNSRPTPIVT